MEHATDKSRSDVGYGGFLMSAAISAFLLGSLAPQSALAECRSFGADAGCFTAAHQLSTASADSDGTRQIDELRERLLKSLNTPGQSEPFDQLMERYSKLLRPPSGSAPTVAGIPMPLLVSAPVNLAPEVIFRRAAPSVLFVRVQRSASSPLAEQGSAVAISPIVAMTNCHVVMYGDRDEDDPSFRLTNPMQIIQIQDSSGQQDSAEVILQHPDIDICLIRTRKLELKPIAGVVPYSVLQIGERVYSLGNPQGLRLTFAEGILSQKRDAVRLGHGQCADIIQHSAPQSGGSSGGALLNSGGLLIGITQSHNQKGQNLNFAVPAALLWEKYGDGSNTPVKITSPLYGGAVSDCP